MHVVRHDAVGVDAYTVSLHLTLQYLHSRFGDWTARKDGTPFFDGDGDRTERPRQRLNRRIETNPRSRLPGLHRLAPVGKIGLSERGGLSPAPDKVDERGTSPRAP